jgi:hypothetical protein
MKKHIKNIPFWKTYELDINYSGKAKQKWIKINMNDRDLLFNIIKKRKEYHYWQPENKYLRIIIQQLEKLDNLQRKNNA